jgi:kynurenine 3-monooxygenase
MPHDGDENSFDKLTSKEAVNNFFKNKFPDFYVMMPEIADQWETHPLSALAIIRCYPWAIDKVALMGDAAHATVPFFGQGMNAGFEDCTVLSNLMKKHNENWSAIFEEYSENRKKDGDALQDLSLDNYIEMRDLVGDPDFLLRKKIEAKFSKLHPEKWMPLYSQVTFSNIPYHEAFQRGKYQESIMKEIMADASIHEDWDKEEVMNQMLDLLSKNEFIVK